MTRTPLHVAIIPDGNRRWAKAQGISGYASLYNRGVDGLVAVTQRAFDLGITHLTLWGSSHANLTDRSSEFFVNIDKAFRDNIHRFAEHPSIEQYDVRIQIIGEWRSSLTPKTIEAFEKIIADNAHRRGCELTLLIDYSGTRERAAAAKSLIAAAPASVTENSLLEHAWTSHLPPVDLIIRTGSWQDPHNSAGFLSLLADEAQLSFPELYWPDFTGDRLASIVGEFQARERRHGK